LNSYLATAMWEIRVSEYSPFLSDFEACCRMGQL
jgi:hypothetical protein